MNDFIPYNPKDLSKMLIWHRKRSKITQQTLADLAGVSRTAVQRLENGTSPIQTDTLRKVLEILNIKICYSSPIMAQYMTENLSKDPTNELET